MDFPLEQPTRGCVWRAPGNDPPPEGLAVVVLYFDPATGDFPDGYGRENGDGEWWDVLDESLFPAPVVAWLDVAPPRLNARRVYSEEKEKWEILPPEIH